MSMIYKGEKIADVGGSGVTIDEIDDTVRTAIRETVRDELLKPSSPGGWHRPSDWPDYSRISLTGFEGMYFTYRTGPLRDGATGFASFTASTQDGTPFTVERGQIKGGAFVAEASFSTESGGVFSEAIPGAAGGYVVYRLTAGSGITSIGMRDFPAGDGGTLRRRTQNCVERYGRLPNLTSFSWWNIGEIISDTIYDCTGLPSLASCWNGCSSLTSLDLTGWDVSNVTSLASCWQNCASLTSLDLTGWDVSNVTNLINCWQNCSSLRVLKICPIYLSFNLSASTCYSPETLASVLALLPTVAAKQTVTLGAANKAKLTEEQIAVATAKNWNVA